MNRFWRILRLGLPGVTGPIGAARRAVAWWALGSVAFGAVLGWIGGDMVAGIGIGLLALLAAIAVTGWHGAFRLAEQIDTSEAPLLELGYDEGDPTCHQEDWVDPPPNNWLGAERYRVRVTNRSTKTIDGVSLSLMQFTPQGAPFLPMPLKVVGDDLGVRSIDQALHGGERRYYEVAWVGFDRAG